MNVLHINAGNMYGGVETFLVELARDRHVCPDMEPSFAVFFDGRFSREIEEQGLRVHRLGNVRIRHPWTVWNARKNLERLLNEKRFDIAITHMAWNHAIAGLVIRNAGIPLVTWVHGPIQQRTWVDYWAMRVTADLAIFNSEFTGRLISDRPIGTSSKLVYYPVPFMSTANTTRAQIRDQLSVPSETIVIIQVSRMEAWKGHEFHLNALSKIQRQEKWICWIVGGAQSDAEKAYVAQLKKKATNLGIAERVKFLGQRSDVPDLLAAADIFCQPNRDPEPFGIVFVEALRAGLPVISTKMGGVSEIVNSECGILVNPSDVSNLSQALSTLISCREMRETMSRAASVRGRELCDPHRQIPRLREVLLPLCRA